MKIILVRHGRPEKSDNQKLNAAGFANWVKNYNRSSVDESSRPIDNLRSQFNDFYIVSSDLPRAIHSSEIVFERPPDLVSEVYREMDIPRFKLPFVLNAWTWVYLNRFLWMLGKRGAFESYKEARARSALAASELMNLAKNEQDIILFSHGYLIVHVRKHLRGLGFKQLSSSNDYWGISAFEA